MHGSAEVGTLYRLDRDLQILNELKTAFWISTYKAENTRFIWANLAALRLWNKPSLDAFLSTDIVSGRSVAVAKIHDELYQNVQVRTLLPR
jgi:hypothetical protein